eukprot:g2462.t1
MNPPPLPPRWDLRLPAGDAHFTAIEVDHAADVGTNYPECTSQQSPGVREGSAHAPRPRHWRTWYCGRKVCTATEALEAGEIQRTAPAASNAKEEGGVTVGALLPESIYVWACGEQLSDQEEDLKTSDELIGCLILLLQALSYIVVIQRSGELPDDPAYSLLSVTAALYLLVQTASPDLRAGFSLLVDGASSRYRSFGAAMLVVFGLLVTAAMKVIFSSAENDGAVVANAVTVLFIADLDEKARSFFVTVPQRWRLFWLVNIIGVSYALALVGVVYVGDASAVNGGTDSYGSILEALPAWFVFVVNPAAMVFFSLCTSRLLQAVCDTRTASGDEPKGVWLCKLGRNGIGAAAKALRLEPCFYAVLGVWLIVSGVGWWRLWGANAGDSPLAVTVSSFSSTASLDDDPYDRHGPQLTTNVVELVAANLALAAGLMMMALRSARDRARSPSSDQEEDLQTSDELIGGLILLFQALSYVVIIKRSGKPPDEPGYTLLSVTAALYLLVQTASPDLRAGFSLLVDGASARYRSFGAAMLVVFGLLVTAAMKVIFSSAENDGAVVANAVTVLFIADLDEKARSFFVTVPQRWRLFWLMNIISVSFALALIGVVHVAGDSVDVETENYGSDLEALPAWYVFVVNPAAMVFFSLCTSRLLQAMCDIRAASGDEARGVSLWELLRNGIGAAAKALRLEPCFYAVLGVWLIVSGVGWWKCWSASAGDSPLAVTISSFSSTTPFDDDYYYDRHGPQLTENKVELVAANLALAAGLTMMALRSARDRARSPMSISGPQHSRRFNRDHGNSSTRRQKTTRVPALLVGWGLGYWMVSLLYLLGASWPQGSWAGAPFVMDIVGYILLPLTFLLGVFVVADSNVYGTGVERVLKPVAAGLADNTRVLHWMMVTVLRDITVVWIGFTSIVVPFLDLV